MQMPSRKYSATTSTGYRFSLNGQEKDVELNEAITTAMYWEYDSRIGRRWNVDPVLKVGESSYSCFSNNPILRVDPNGDSDSTSNGSSTSNSGGPGPKKSKSFSVGAPFPLGNFSFAVYKTIFTNLRNGMWAQDYKSFEDYKLFKSDEPSSMYSPLSVTKMINEKTSLTQSINVYHYKFLIRVANNEFVYRPEGGLNEVSYNRTYQTFLTPTDKRMALGVSYGGGAGIMASQAGIPHEIEGQGAARAESFNTVRLWPLKYQYAGVGGNLHAGVFLKITQYFQINGSVQIHANHTINLKAYDVAGNVSIDQNYSSVGVGYMIGSQVNIPIGCRKRK
jgi:hypothetical protein